MSPDLKVTREDGYVVLVIGAEKSTEAVRKVLTPKEAQRLAGALNICATMPPGVESVNFDIRTD